MAVGRLANSWGIVKASGRVMWQDKGLMVFPVLSFLASAVTVALITGVAQAQGLLPNIFDAQGHVRPLAFVLAGLSYFILACIQVFFGAAVVAGASQRLAGKDPSIASSLAATGRRAGRLLAWAAVTATVSVILQLIRERGGLVGRWFAGLGGMAWALATYFVIPVLLFEEVPVGRSVGRAGSLFKGTWGETVVGTGGVGLVFMLACMPLALVGFVALSMYATSPALALALLAVVVLAFVVLGVLQSVFSGVYKAALYRYATTSQVPPGFMPGQVQGAFAPSN